MDAAQHNGKRKDRGDRGSASRKPKRAHLRALEPTTCPACGRYFNSGRGLANHLRAGCSVQVPDGAKSPDDALTYDATSDDEGDSGGTRQAGEINFTYNLISIAFSKEHYLAAGAATVAPQRKIQEGCFASVLPFDTNGGIPETLKLQGLYQAL